MDVHRSWATRTTGQLVHPVGLKPLHQGRDGQLSAVRAGTRRRGLGGFLTTIHAPINQVHGGAEIMHYGGDTAELLLAAALVATWRPTRHPRTTAPAQGRQPSEA